MSEAPLRKRLRRWEIEGDVRFITFSCYARRPFLCDAAARDRLVECLQAARWERRRQRFALYAWVIMPEHVHLLLRPAGRWAPIASSIKIRSAKSLLRPGETRFWQPGGTGGSPGEFGTKDGFASLSSSNQLASGFPRLFRSSTTDPGLNIFEFTWNMTASFTAGTQAFVGGATWRIEPGMYAQFARGAKRGNVYFPAANASDISDAQIIGEYFVLPAPGALAMTGLGGLAAARRRR